MHEPHARLVRIRGLLVWEVLLYSLLVGCVLWWRLAAEANTLTTATWPSPADMRLSWPRGIWLASLLLASSFTMLQALRTAANRACCASWLGWTLGFGLLFLAFQLNEFRTRIRHNLVPSLTGAGIHNRADLNHLSAVRYRLQELATELNAAAIKANTANSTIDNTELSTTREERLAIVNRLLTSELAWTELRISQQSPPQIADQRAAMTTLAQDIFPIQAYAETHQQFCDNDRSELSKRIADADRELVAASESIAANSEPLQVKLAEVAELNRQLKTIRDQLKKLPPDDEPEEAEEAFEAPSNEASPREQALAPEQGGRRTALEQQLKTLQPLYELANTELTQVASLVTSAEDAASQLRAQIANTASRQQMIADMPSGGLNQLYHWLRLPVAIPSGRNWSIAYFGLMLFHLLHMLAGMTRIFPRLARCERPLALVGLASYWHFQVLAGCILLGLFYVI